MTAPPCALLLALAALSLAACGDQSRPAPDVRQNIDAAAEKARQAAVSAGQKAGELAEKARDNTKAYLQSPEVKERAADAKAAVKDALDGLKPKPDGAADNRK